MAASIPQPLLLTEAAKPINLVSSTAFERLAKNLQRAQGTIQPGKSSFLSACPALPLALFSLSSLLSCLCGISPILSDSEKVLVSESPPPPFFFSFFIFFFLFLASFFKGVLSGDRRAFSEPGPCHAALLAAPALCFPGQCRCSGVLSGC